VLIVEDDNSKEGVFFRLRLEFHRKPLIFPIPVHLVAFKRHFATGLFISDGDKCIERVTALFAYLGGERLGH